MSLLGTASHWQRNWKAPKCRARRVVFQGKREIRKNSEICLQQGSWAIMEKWESHRGPSCGSSGDPAPGFTNHVIERQRHVSPLAMGYYRWKPVYACTLLLPRGGWEGGGGGVVIAKDSGGPPPSHVI
jgi:hypothetical protein